MKNLVQQIDGKAVTTSRKVAEIFEKQHKDILRAIRELEIPNDYRERNFAPSVYDQPNPSGGKPIQQPEYLITRDGFTLLAMGFTGKKAMQFKIAYIEAFNAMEAQLRQQESTGRNYSGNIIDSTTELLDRINRQLISGKPVEKELLRYASSVVRVIHTPMRRLVNVLPGSVQEFILNHPCGEYSRNEVYSAYCAQCAEPLSARCFWQAVRSVRPLTERRTATIRFVVFK